MQIVKVKILVYLLINIIQFKFFIISSSEFLFFSGLWIEIRVLLVQILRWWLKVFGGELILNNSIVVQNVIDLPNVQVNVVMQMLMVLLRRLVSTFFFFHCCLWTLLFCSICDSAFISFFLLLSVLTSLLIDFKLLNYHFSILLQVFRWFAFIRRRLISLLKKGYFLKVTAD
jgi:hypothetical protein